MVSSAHLMKTFARMRQWFAQVGRAVRAEADGEEPVATPPHGSLGVREQETSTNAQMQGASDEPWPGNR